jgi:hypothetical protein
MPPGAIFIQKNIRPLAIYYYFTTTLDGNFGDQRDPDEKNVTRKKNASRSHLCTKKTYRR